MVDANKDEISRLVGDAKTDGYSGTIDASHLRNGAASYHGEDDDKASKKTPELSRFWKFLGIASLSLLVGFVAGTIIPNPMQAWTAPKPPPCRFCDQLPPKLHREKSYTIRIPDREGGDGDGESTALVTVTPATVSYDYELYDGENIYTNYAAELIPNLGFDYAVLEIGSARNLNRETGENVSLDEVYVHHFTLSPVNMLGAEVLARDDDGREDPYMRLPAGYALHVLDDERPYLSVNAHLLSNKNLEPIGGSSLERARKECNECYYAPGKGSDCTPEVSGTFRCCGDSPACTVGGEDCACATATTSNTNTQTHTHANNNKRAATTKYRIELDLLISRDIDKFRRVDQWNFAAPSCAVNLRGDPVLEVYPPDNYCAKTTDGSSRSPTSVLYDGGGSFFHQVPENDEMPYLRTTVNVLAPSSGTLLWAQSHLHTGGVNATLHRNGKIVCTTKAFHGTDPDPSTNARNERNHLARIGSCYDQISPGGIRFDAGDVFTTESYYYAGRDDDRFSGEGAAGEHKNVMSMFFTGVDFDGDSDYLTEERTSFNLWNDFVHVAGIKSERKYPKRKSNRLGST